MGEYLDLVFDCDGVLGNTIKKVLFLYNLEYGTNMKYEDVKHGNLKKVQLPGTDMNKYFTQKGFYRDIEPIAGAQFYLKSLSQHGHKITIASAFPVFATEERLDWFAMFFPFISPNDIQCIHDKSIFYSDMILDDGQHNIVGSNCNISVLYNQPWNMNLSAKYQKIFNVKRVSSWKEYFWYVQEVSASRGKIYA